ncbi:hypothetical protein VPNG_06814 [Cytospora leucostoma]|uniref:FAD-binding PCMH-type domain-containing protein n=1 Tax=Cytospora leucostoma TaxID=1230097 RepID=A0A423WW01_9PEZI|nr:hypothetical protein VPNG_06814 [Cytospora leucostoma]
MQNSLVSLGLLLASLTRASPLSSASKCSTRSFNASTLFAEEKIQLTDTSLNNLAKQLSERSIGINYTAINNVFGFSNSTSVSTQSTADCKTYAGDSAWPDELLWYAFDLLLNDALLEVPPIGSSCYTNWDNYDEDLCASLSAEFTNSYLHMDHPTSIMSPFYQGATCMPVDGAPANCTLGGFPFYVVNATNVAQIQLAVNVARNLNLRLVIKNTGHDFAGKSAGEGALSIWTHNLKGLKYTPHFSGSKYTGPAFKMGSGVQSFEVYAAAKVNGVTVVGGEGATVGIAGGYIQGGGHSPLSSLYGLASDQVLAYQVVTADGRFLTASDDENTDLFWALRGGGGSTFGVVTSVTIKAYPKIGATISNFTLTTGDDLDSETFWVAMRLFWNHFIDYADAGAYSYFRFYSIGEDSYYFGMTPFFTPNLTVEEHTALLQPWLDELTSLNVSLTWITEPTYYDNFYDAWAESFPLETVGLDAGRVASRLFPRENWQNSTLQNETWAAVKNTTENGFYFTGFNMKNDLSADNTANSANPAWRKSILHAITAVSWTDPTSSEDILDLSNSMTYGCLDQWRVVTPGSGSYLGEADSAEPNWQQSFWGSNYDQLLSLKHKYDPNDVFYALNAVGSEKWKVKTETGLPTQNGKLCRV